MVEYSNYSNIFLVENKAELLKNTEMNEYVIKLEEGKQPLFGSIYSLGPVELETLKIYIKTNLANGFIRLFKSPIRIFILFDRKLYRYLCLCIDDQSLNNVTIQNQYPLSLISELLNWLERIKWLTQLDFTNICYWMKICKGDK